MTFLIESLFAQRKPIEDPWGAGMKFWVFPNNHPAALAAAGQDSRRRAGRKLLRVMREKLASEGETPTLEDLRRQLLDGDVNVALVVEALEDEIDDLMVGQNLAELAAARVERWDGVNDENGDPVPLTMESAIALFSTSAVLPAEAPGSEHVSVGAALAQLVLTESMAAQEERAIGEAQAAKNLPTSGAGASASGAGSAKRSTGGKRQRKSKG